MAIFDLSVLGFLLITLAVGVSRGFIREVSSVLAWILAGIATFWDFPLLKSFTRTHIDMPLVADAVAMIAVFVIAFTIISLIGTVCANLVRGTLISPVDRTLGAVAGLLKGVVLLGVLEILVSCFLPRSSLPRSVQKTLCKPFIDTVGDAIRQCLPEVIQNQLNSLHKALASPASSLPAPAQEGLKSEGMTTVSDKVKALGELEPRPETSPGGVYTEEQKEQLNRFVENASQSKPMASAEGVPTDVGPVAPVEKAPAESDREASQTAAPEWTQGEPLD